MCGIAALIRRPERPVTAQNIEAMTAAVAHRGPDGQGFVFLEPHEGALEPGAAEGPWQAALGHRRLAIIDLSAAGNQPMSYRGRFWITYNGEVYNYLELRRELEQQGHTFRSNTDTEVILAAYAEWGADCFSRLRGMWGLVLIDAVRRVAVLSRDRLGIKPLYRYRGDDFVAVCSEIKQLTHLPFVSLRPDADAVTTYLATGYEDTARSFFASVEPVAAGTWQMLDLDTLQERASDAYWHPERVTVAIRDAHEAAQLFSRTFHESVQLHLRSDVPVGCALSGGLDSSAVASVVQAVQPQRALPLHTFTATFPGEPIDERQRAEQVARHVGARWHFVTPTAGQFLEELDRFIWIHDEPVGSLSQYAGYCVARLARERGVPVALNGQGGDEILAGYWQSYFMYLRELLRSGHLWHFGRHVAGALAPSGNGELVRQTPVMLRRYRSRRRAQDAAVRAPSSGQGTPSPLLARVMGLSERERRVHEIREMYLPRLLKWDDRNFMAFSVEGRYPFLDHPLIELSLACAPGVLYKGGWTKHPLRRGLGSLLPREIVWQRVKLGFETPQHRWLSETLRTPIEALLRSEARVWAYADRDQARGFAQQVWTGKRGAEEAGQALFRLYVLERWMTLFDLVPDVGEPALCD